MSSTLELDSTFRNRQLWPKPGEFEVLISQTGRNTFQNMLDPVCTSIPIISWTSHLFDTNALGNTYIKCVVSNTLLGHASGPTTYNGQRALALEVTAVPLSSFQEQYNYYFHSVLTFKAGHSKRRVARILEYTYLGSERAQLILDVFDDQEFHLGETLTIWDPSDFSDPNNSYLFVPTGSSNSGDYLQKIIYNQTTNQSKSIKSYDGKTGLLAIDGNTLGWTIFDNYSIRSSAPNYTFVAGASSTSNQVVITGVAALSNINFQNWFLRIPANLYNNTVTPPQKDSRRIVQYDSATKIAVVNPLLTASPVGMNVELMQIGYDNANPFNWKGNMTGEIPLYRIKLKSLILPNLLMSVGNGGKPAYANYFYIELSNVDTSNAQLYNIFSNNPYSSRAMFRATVKDLHNLEKLKFIPLEGDMTQTVRFRLDSNVKIRIVVPNTGETFETIEKDTTSPNTPNTNVQICALFDFIPI